MLDCLWCLRSWRESVAESGNSVKPCADFFTHGTVSSLVERLGLMLLYHVALRLVFLPWNVDLKVDLGIVTIHLQQHVTGCRPQWISMLPSYHKLQHSTPLHLAFFQSRIPSPASTRRLLPNQNQVEPSKQGTHPPTPSTLHNLSENQATHRSLKKRQHIPTQIQHLVISTFPHFASPSTSSSHILPLLRNHSHKPPPTPSPPSPPSSLPIPSPTAPPP